MNRDHVISDSLFSEAQAEFAIGRNWIAYNTKTYFLDNADMWFFRDKDEALEFARDNISDVDAYAVIHANSIISLMRQLPYAEDIHFNLTKAELEELFNTFDWNETFYDPLHDTIEASTDKDKEELAKMETLLIEWELLYKRDPQTAIELADKYWLGHPMEQYKNDFITTIKKIPMNENNLAYLEKQLTNLGFGDHMNAEMKKHIESERSEFNVQHTFNYGGKDMLADLAFKRGEQNEMYFFNSFRATMKDDPNLSQTFRLNKGNSITSKEAFNLLQGRAVYKHGLENKEGEKYNAWVQLDIKGDKDLNQNFKMERYHDNYGYDLQKSLDQLILKPMNEKEAEDLQKSLLKGNVQSVTFLKDGEEVKGFIQANPKDKTIEIYDGHMKPLSKEAKKDFIDHHPGKEKDQKQEVKATPADEGGDDGTLKKKRTRGKKNGVGI